MGRQLAGSDQPDQPTLLQDLLRSAKRRPKVQVYEEACREDSDRHSSSQADGTLKTRWEILTRFLTSTTWWASLVTLERCLTSLTSDSMSITIFVKYQKPPTLSINYPNK